MQGCHFQSLPFYVFFFFLCERPSNRESRVGKKEKMEKRNTVELASSG